MNVTTIELSKEEATKKYKEYLEANKRQKSKEYSAARRAYRALSKGLKVIDIYDAFKRTGLKSDGRPKLAIIRADAKVAYFEKLADGAGRFTIDDPKSWNSHPRYASDVVLPENTFKDWELIDPLKGFGAWNNVIDKDSQTNVPFIPAHIAVPGKLENYYILFEVSEWRTVAKVRDPYLLQRLNANTFIVLSEWDVSPVEAIVMRGQ